MIPSCKPVIAAWITSAAVALLLGAGLLPASAGEVDFRQPDQFLYIDNPTPVASDDDYRARFQDDHTSVIEGRIGDSPKNHIWQERELLLTSGNPNYCDPLKPFDSIERFDIASGKAYRWSLEYSGSSGGPEGTQGASYKLTWTFDGQKLEVDLTEPISEILIRAYADKPGTSMEVIPLRLIDNFKSCVTTHAFGLNDIVTSNAEGAKWRRVSLEHMSQKFVLEGISTFRFDAADPPLRSHLAFQIKLNCNTPSIPNPPKMRISAFPWSWTMQVVAGGMEALDVRSRTRVMADELYVPNGRLKTNKLAAAHLFQLKVADAHWVKNDLIRFQFFNMAPTEPGVHVVKVTFHLESADECCRITQWYEMHPTLNPWNNVDRGKLPYPTTGMPGNIVADEALYPVEKFLPITYYEWLPKCKDVALERMEISTRANWPAGKKVMEPDSVTGSTIQAASEFSRDPDGALADFLTLWRYGVEFLEVDNKPTVAKARLMHEQTGFGFLNNESRPAIDWDNYHYSKEHDEIDAPGGLVGALGHFTPPGCPECVHIHWRWGGFLLWPDGKPQIPKKEQGCWPSVPKQSLMTYAILHRAAERRALLSTLRNGENLYLDVGKAGVLSDSYVPYAKRQAFGYTPSSKALSNAFFAHGMAFNGLWSLAREANNYRSFRIASGTPPAANN